VVDAHPPIMTASATALELLAGRVPRRGYSETMVQERRTKIVATLGPASDSPEKLRALVAAGMDAARLNLSHGTHAEHAERARRVREAEAEAGRPVALIADLQGPKLRIGELVEPVVLRKGDDVVVCPEERCSGNDLPIAPAVIADVLKPGHDVLIDDGLVRLRVGEVEHGRAHCEVIVGGRVSSHKGVNLPGVPLPVPSLTRKDTRDLEFALALGVDFVALSFVRSPADVRDLRALIEQAGSHAHVIAKIEKAEAIDVLDDVLAETDAVMVARGDLGVEIGPALVPLVQKRIIQKSLERGKPVITATQMLESMVHHPEPTRAEASDVANAILDGTSAVMLSGETAVGDYPLEAVAYMDRIALAVEPSMGYRHETPTAEHNPTIGGAMSNAACDIAEALRAKAILTPTYRGKTASSVARLRPQRPIIGLTHIEWARRQMALEWGVTPIQIPECNDVEELWTTSVHAAREAGLIEVGDRVVLTAGTQVNLPGSTNVIKVEIA
jgi:pyruvate kinase